MRDTELSVWTRIGPAPVKMGALYVTDAEARFSYAPGYAETGLPGLSLCTRPCCFTTAPSCIAAAGLCTHGFAP